MSKLLLDISSFLFVIVICGKHPLKYTTKISKAAIPIVGYAAFVI